MSATNTTFPMCIRTIGIGKAVEQFQDLEGVEVLDPVWEQEFVSAKVSVIRSCRYAGFLSAAKEKTEEEFAHEARARVGCVAGHAGTCPGTEGTRAEPPGTGAERCGQARDAPTRAEGGGRASRLDRG